MAVPLPQLISKAILWYLQEAGAKTLPFPHLVESLIIRHSICIQSAQTLLYASSHLDPGIFSGLQVHLFVFFPLDVFYVPTLYEHRMHFRCPWSLELELYRWL